MKKILTSLLILFLIQICTAKETKEHTWKRITNNISIDATSFEKFKGGRAAWFKSTDSQVFYDDRIAYQYIKWRGFCGNDFIDILETKSFDEQGNLLEHNLGDGRGIGPSYHGYVNGEIYYGALCGVKKIKAETKRSS